MSEARERAFEERKLLIAFQERVSVVAREVHPVPHVKTLEVEKWKSINRKGAAIIMRRITESSLKIDRT